MDYIRDRVMEKFDNPISKEDEDDDDGYEHPDHLDTPQGEGKSEEEKMEPEEMYDRLIRDCWKDEDGDVQVKVTAEGGQERVVSLDQLVSNLYDAGDWDDDQIEDFVEHIEDQAD